MADRQVKIEVTADTTKADAKLKGLEGQAKKTASAGGVTDAVNKSWAGLSGALQIAEQAYHAVSGAVNAAVGSFAEEQQAQMSLVAALEAKNNLLEGGIGPLQEYASEVQKTLKIGDEQVLNIMATVEAFSGLSQEALPQAAQAAIQWAAMSGKSIESATMDINKGLNGNFMMFKRYGMAMEDAGNATANLAQILDKTSAGMAIAQARAESFSGKISGIKNTFDELLESLGAAITENGGVKAFLGELDTAIAEMTSPTQMNAVKSLASSLGQAGVMALKLLRLINLIGESGVYQIVERGFNAIADAIGGINVLLTGMERSMAELRGDYRKAVELYIEQKRMMASIFENEGEQGKIAAAVLREQIDLIERNTGMHDGLSEAIKTNIADVMDLGEAYADVGENTKETIAQAKELLGVEYKIGETGNYQLEVAKNVNAEHERRKKYFEETAEIAERINTKLRVQAEFMADVNDGLMEINTDAFSRFLFHAEQAAGFTNATNINVGHIAEQMVNVADESEDVLGPLAQAVTLTAAIAQNAQTAAYMLGSVNAGITQSGSFMDKDYRQGYLAASGGSTQSQLEGYQQQYNQAALERQRDLMANPMGRSDVSLDMLQQLAGLIAGAQDYLGANKERGTETNPLVVTIKGGSGSLELAGV